MTLTASTFMSIRNRVKNATFFTILQSILPVETISLSVLNALQTSEKSNPASPSPDNPNDQNYFTLWSLPDSWKLAKTFLIHPVCGGIAACPTQNTLFRLTFVR